MKATGTLTNAHTHRFAFFSLLAFQPRIALSIDRQNCVKEYFIDKEAIVEAIGHYVPVDQVDPEVP